MMGLPAFIIVLTALSPIAEPGNWCRIGQSVMIPDGREGPVTMLDGELCHVMVYGESRETRWAFYIIEPVDPPAPLPRRFGH